jgi:nucleoid-associated protein YgaU
MLLLTSCATAVPRWRVDAILTLNAVRKAGGDTRYPDEFDNAARSVERAETLTRDREIEEADRYYRMALLESEFIERKLAAERVAREIEAARRLEEERRRLEEFRRDEEARLAREKAQAEQQQALAAEQVRRAAERARPQAKPLSAYHTVKRGETLPQISSLPDVYNDNMLWPLLYRANRDQIRDPRHLWPGQVLRIPRGVSREDLAEARRYAQDKPLH